MHRYFNFLNHVLGKDFIYLPINWMQFVILSIFLWEHRFLVKLFEEIWRESDICAVPEINIGF